ncbi:MAG: pectate lyase [Planctomycetota bacterium]
MYSRLTAAVLILWAFAPNSWALDPLEERAALVLRKATEFYTSNVASHGGYVYHYALDLDRRWGEGEATKNQVWVQPPGTPTVGLAFIRAYEATGEQLYLDAATDAAMALVYGQLKSGGWTNVIDFDPKGQRLSQYLRGGGKGKNNSSLDDGQTQSAILCLIRVDAAHKFRHKAIHDAARLSLDALLKAQFPNGGFPQVWTGPVKSRPIVKASFPDYDWRTEGRIKNYWDMYTLNDNVTGYVAETLIAAYEIYGDQKYDQALRRLGDFLILAQLPEPQPGWAQQYNESMHPIWARRFEPPGVSGDETQEVLQTLMVIAHATGENKYLEPIPSAVRWLKRSMLPDGKIARYYELETNRPLYMKRRGDVYELTYDDSNLPSHYSWKTSSRLLKLREMYQRATAGQSPLSTRTRRQLTKQSEQIISNLDPSGRWVSRFDGTRIVGQLKLPVGTPYLSSGVFSENITTLADFIALGND